MNVTRAVSRLKTVLFNFDVAAPTGTTSPLLVQKEFNSFVHPMAGIYDFNEELEYQIQIGSKMIPEYPVRSLAHA